MQDTLTIAEKKISQIVGRRIKKMRNQKGLTGKALGLQLRLSQQHISRIESGSVRINVEQLHLIAYILEVGLTELLQGVGYQAKQLYSPFFCTTTFQANSLVVDNYS